MEGFEETYLFKNVLEKNVQRVGGKMITHSNLRIVVFIEKKALPSRVFSSNLLYIAKNKEQKKLGHQRRLKNFIA